MQTRFPGLVLTQGDVLDVDFATELASGDWRLVGNLPYNVSSPLLLKLADHRGLIRDMHFMLQKEMAQRMAASPGSKSWGRLSVMLQLGWQIEALFDVPPEAFAPPPKVMSQVVRLTPLATPHVVRDRSALERVVSAAFGQRRKRLSNSLRAFNVDFESHGLLAQQRVEEVTVAQFVSMANAVARSSGLAE